MLLCRWLKQAGAVGACIGVFMAGGRSEATAQVKQADVSGALSIAPNFAITSFDMVGSKIVLHVRLNGKNVGNMVLDTGANSCILPQAAATLGLKLEPYPEAGPKSKYAEIATLSIGNVKLRDVSVEVSHFPVLEAWNKAHPESKICGLLGRDGVDKWAVGLDFVSHTMGWWQGGKLPPEQVRAFNSLLHVPGDAPGAIRVLPPGASVTLCKTVVTNPPLAFKAPQALPLYTKEEDGYYLVRVGLEGVLREMALDTGSDSSSVSAAVGAKFHPLFKYASQVQGMEQTGIGMTNMLRSLTLGNASFDFCPVIVMPSSKEVASGKKGDHPLGSEAVLGMDVLANCRVIMDFPGKMLYVSPYADYNHTPERLLQRLGVFASPTSQAKDHYKIYVVFAGYPAAQAGIKAEDELLDINGTPTSRWFADPDKMLPDKTFTLRVRRKGVEEPLTFTLPLPTT